MKKCSLLFFTLIILSACVKDKPKDNIQPQVQLTTAKKVYIINEGNFGSANASVSLYDLGNDAIVDNIYKVQNSANPSIGDVAQSLSFINNKFYLVVNNSGKIIVCDNQFKKVTQITNLSSPRYILQVTNQKAYVSDYNGNSVSIIDLNSNTKTGSISCKGWTEKMALIYNKAFITNMNSNYVYVVNTINDLITDSIYVSLNAGSLVIDKNDKLWVLNSGNSINTVSGSLTRINTVTNQIETSFNFPANNFPKNLCINKTKDTLYFINKGIYRMPIYASAIPSTEFIPNGNKNFYGLDINPTNSFIYTSDAIDYVQKSNIYVYDPNGNLTKNFKAGINANGFYFE
jgi:hypothetical protein